MSLGTSGRDVLESVFEHAPFGVYVDHPTKGCTYANPFLLDQFGIPWEAFQGFGWARSVLPEDVERMQVAIQQYEHSREPINITYRVRHPDGSLRWVHARVRAVVDDAGHHVGSAGLTTDVTEQRAFEERLGAAQKLEAVGSLAARLAHDLNNLLTVVMASTEVLAPQAEANPNDVAALAAIDLACDQARQLTEQLLLLSGSRVSGRASTRVDEEMHRISRLLDATLGEGIEVILQLGAGGAHVALDGSALTQIVLNLATNARDAMEGRGQLTIVTRSDGRHLTLVVQDSGSGMDEATAARAFEPFFTTKEEGRGTGLGLATILDLVTVAGGGVRLDTAPGAGTSAVVTLPVVQDRAPSEGTDEVSPAPVTPLRILIVEDNEAVRQSVAYALALVGHSIESAGSVAEARASVDRSGRFDLLVSDVLLPDGSGVDFHRSVRGKGPLPVVFMSGFAGRDAGLLEGLEGESTFVAKPFRPHEIVRAVSHVTSRVTSLPRSS